MEAYVTIVMTGVPVVKSWVDLDGIGLGACDARRYDGAATRSECLVAD